MSPEQVVWCIKALAKYKPTHISDDDWEELVKLVDATSISPKGDEWWQELENYATD